MNNRRRKLFGVVFVVLITLGGGHSALADTASELNAAGVERYKEKDYHAAADLFVRAYELAPDNQTVRHNLANAYHALANELAQQGDISNGVELLEYAVGLEPENAMPLIQLGAYYLRLNLITDATYRLEEAVELAPDNVDARYLLGEAYYRGNDLVAALAEWEWVEKVEPRHTGLKERLEKARREATVELGFRDSGSRHFTIRYDPGTSGYQSRNVLQMLERAYRDIGIEFGRVYPTEQVPVIVYTAEGFSDATLLAEHVGAVYDGKIRVPVVDKQGTVIDDEELRRRLYHEYVHVIVRLIADDNVPWWLNEGLAQLFSQEFTEQERQMVLLARDNNALYNLANLEANQLQTLDADAIRLAYAQSHATVVYMYQRFGKRRLQQLMADLGAGIPTADSMQYRYRRDYATLEREVAAGLDSL